MTGATHAAGGAFVGALAGLAAGDPVTGALTGAAAALLPDIDHPGSLAGRKAPLVSVAMSALAGHRTVTHTVLFCALVAAGAGFLGSWLAGLGLCAFSGPKLALCAFSGALSHLALDACTKTGVEPLAPFLPLHPRGVVVTGSLLDRLTGLALTVMTFLVLKACL